MVLYGCEIWYLTLTEEHRLRVSENRVLRRLFEPKTDERAPESHVSHRTPCVLWLRTPQGVPVYKDLQLHTDGKIQSHTSRVHCKDEDGCLLR